jgi:cytochrome bd-type quinol oxidase subunit 2
VSNVETMIDLPQVEARINEQVTTTVMANSDVQAAVDVPQIHAAVDLLTSVWWWLTLLSLATPAEALGVSRRRRRTLRAWAVTTTVLALLVLITLRVTRGLLPQVRPENRDAVGAMYDVLAGSLRTCTLWLLGAVLLILVLTGTGPDPAGEGPHRPGRHGGGGRGRG